MQDPKGALNERLAKAMHDQRYEMVPDLLALGADANALAQVPGWPSLRPLARAAMFEKFETCKLLIEAGAVVDLADEHGNTPLHLAAAGSSEVLLELLIAHGADLNRPDSRGYTSLHNGARDFLKGRCAYLIAQGADVFHRTLDNRTALHSAAHADKVDACRALLAAGLLMNDTPEVVAADYLTPFQLSVTAGSVNVVRMALEECGEDLEQRSVAGKTLFELAGESKDRSIEMLSLLLSIQTERALTATLPAAEVTQSRQTRGFPSL